ncbi:unnamed protein product [Orchesella dallaii]|uniref:CRAL-TRIO domain-containing protein n=2 Tax=Orchesella dallaii TaxID=48710 RepID=A0ABP1PYN4_9HEXA
MKLKVESEKEQETLNKFKEVTADLKVDDETLIRFMRAREWDLNRAEDMLRKSIKWREDNNVSSYLSYEPPEYLKEDFVFEMLPTDNEGRPVVYVPLGRWNARQWVEKGLKDDCLKFRFYIFEIVAERTRQVNASSITLILDLAELTYYKCASLETMQLLYYGLKDLEANYPEILKTCYMINAPWLFPTAYNFFKPIFSQRTLNKFKIFDSDRNNWHAKLMEVMTDESLPKILKEVVPT